MKKLIFLSLLFILSTAPKEISFGAGFSPVEAIPAFKNLKGDIVTQLNELFGREVSVESISGILINQIELNGVSIAREKKLSGGTIIKAKKIILNYNPFKLAASSGNITAAISKIIIIEPEILVERSIHDEWNMAGLIPKTKVEDEKETPLQINATVHIQGGHGLYMDHLGFGEDLKGQAFTSKIKDLNGEVKLSGNKVNISVTATSVIDRSIVYTRATGNVNIKTGKYRFIVYANNVDMEKWGRYTLNIPHFKPISGISDMKMTMTNPPPRKNGLPILFDGKFNIKHGKAYIFDRFIEDINGSINVYDEDARFKGLSGYKSEAMLTVNGRIYDFTVANYDINIDIPRTDSQKLKNSFPELNSIDFSGKASANIHVGGNYGHPTFKGTAAADGHLIKQKLIGNFDFYYEGSVLKVNSGGISAYGGKLYTQSTFDFTPSIPNLDINISGESLSLKEVLQPFSSQDKADLDAKIKGSFQNMQIDGNASTLNGGEIKVFGTFEADNLNLDLSGKNIKVSQKYFSGKMNSFNGTLKGKINEGLALDGEIGFIDCMIAAQSISEANANFRLKNNQLDISSLMMQKGDSQFFIKGKTGLNCETKLIITAASAEASEIKILESLIPKEFTPVSGNLDASLTVTGQITDAASIDPRKFSIAGTVALRDGSLSYENLKEAYLNINWLNDRLTIKDSSIKTNNTDIIFSGTLEPENKIILDVSGSLELADLKPITLKYGRLFGSSKLICHLEGPLENPNVDVNFDAAHLRYNDIVIGRISGRIIYDGKNIYLANPLDIYQDNDEYVLSGKFALEKNPSLSVKLDILKGNLDTVVSLLDDINAELSSKQIIGQSAQQKPIVLSLNKLKFPQKVSKQLYKSEGNETQIKEIQKAESETMTFSRSTKEKARRHVDGHLIGYLEITGTMANPFGQLDLRVSNGTWESYAFDEAQIKAHIEGGTFEAESVYIKKGDGFLSAYGTFNAATTASFEIKARNMSIDFLSLFVGKGKKFDGIFDMDAFVRGPIRSPNGFASIKSNNVNIAGVPFDGFSSIISLSNNMIDFKKMEFTKGETKTIVSGTLPLYKEGVSVSITMEGESLGLLTLASRDISWISGSGEGHVIISGSLTHPIFDGDIIINNTAMNFKLIDSNLESINSSIKIKNNVMSTDSLKAKWVGRWTQGKVNKVKLSGSLGWDKLFSEAKVLDFDIKLSDGDYLVDFPNLYKGDMETANVVFKGPLSFAPESANAPLLSGVFDLSNGVLTLPDLSKKSKLPPINMDMTLNIGKNTYVVAGDIKNLISTDFSNLLLNLEIEGENIAVSGNLTGPNITGKTIFKRGTVNMLNREFSLMSDERQKYIFSSDLDKVKENSAVFSGGSLPYLALSAEIKVKSTEQILEPALPGEPPKPPTYRTTNVLIVSRITGVPFSEEKDLGIKLAFDSFVEDTTKQPPELVPGKYDEQEIKVLLLPDFIKGPLGISEKGVEQVDANEVLVDYLNSRLNAYLLRNVERDLAKSLELESLSLEYNFGKDLRNMLPAKSVTEIGPQEMPETMYGIGAVKGFFDRFYIDVRYAQAVQEQAIINKALLNYQLTYKLSPVLSVVYYREPFSFIESESDYYKVTLKAGYQL